MDKIIAYLASMEYEVWGEDSNCIVFKGQPCQPMKMDIDLNRQSGMFASFYSWAWTKRENTVNGR